MGTIRDRETNEWIEIPGVEDPAELSWLAMEREEERTKSMTVEERRQYDARCARFWPRMTKAEMAEDILLWAEPIIDNVPIAEYASPLQNDDGTLIDGVTVTAFVTCPGRHAIVEPADAVAVFEELIAAEALYDSGQRRDGEIVWYAHPQN
jgi:hypothetical protein